MAIYDTCIHAMMYKNVRNVPKLLRQQERSTQTTNREEERAAPQYRLL